MDKHTWIAVDVPTRFAEWPTKTEADLHSLLDHVRSEHRQGRLRDDDASTERLIAGIRFVSDSRMELA